MSTVFVKWKEISHLDVLNMSFTKVRDGYNGCEVGAGVRVGYNSEQVAFMRVEVILIVRIRKKVGSVLSDGQKAEKMTRET